MGELAGEAGDDDDNDAGEETTGDACPETWPDFVPNSVLGSADKSALETGGGSLEFKLFLQNQKISHNNLKAKTWKINPVFIRRNVLNNFAPAKNFVAAITTLPLGHV